MQDAKSPYYPEWWNLMGKKSNTTEQHTEIGLVSENATSQEILEKPIKKYKHRLPKKTHPRLRQDV